MTTTYRNNPYRWPQYTIPAFLHRIERRVIAIYALALLLVLTGVLVLYVGNINSNWKWAFPVIPIASLALVHYLNKKNSVQLNLVRAHNGVACTNCAYPYSLELATKRCPECGAFEDPEMAQFLWSQSLNLYDDVSAINTPRPPIDP
ncbi:MAG: hypothetical protein KF691_02720 [Phycisphaeraceae bacterium]|nr:hypothetical protein [Phycisphaeraceae bacterium]